MPPLISTLSLTAASGHGLVGVDWQAGHLPLEANAGACVAYQSVNSASRKSATLHPFSFHAPYYLPSTRDITCFAVPASLPLCDYPHFDVPASFPLCDYPHFSDPGARPGQWRDHVPLPGGRGRPHWL